MKTRTCFGIVGVVTVEVFCEEVAEESTYSQAYEAAYRFVWQYAQREPIDPFHLMLVAMEPVGSQATNDPASWPDWLACVDETVAGSAASIPSNQPPKVICGARSAKSATSPIAASGPTTPA